MYDIKCTECNGLLIVDMELSREHLWTSDKVMYTDTGVLIEETINAEMVYRCVKCEKLFNLTYKDWEALIRKQMVIEIADLKRLIAFRSLDPYTIDPDRGLVFCGQCPGYDSLGNCFSDIVIRCELRKQKLDKNGL
jgi:phage FluMu protein Com